MEGGGPRSVRWSVPNTRRTATCTHLKYSYETVCRSMHACSIKTSRTTFKLEPSKVWAH